MESQTMGVTTIKRRETSSNQETSEHPAWLQFLLDLADELQGFIEDNSLGSLDFEIVKVNDNLTGVQLRFTDPNGNSTDPVNIFANGRFNPPGRNLGVSMILMTNHLNPKYHVYIQDHIQSIVAVLASNFWNYR